MKLQIVQSTTLKQRPLPCTQLTPYERYSGYSGTEFLVDRYIPKDPAHGHIKIILHHPVNQRRTWYAHAAHVKLLDQDNALDLLIAKGTGIYLKQSLLPAEELSEDNRFFLQPAKGLILKEYSAVHKSHWKVELNNPINGKSTWYVRQQAVEISLVSTL